MEKDMEKHVTQLQGQSTKKHRVVITFTSNTEQETEATLKATLCLVNQSLSTKSKRHAGKEF